MEQFCSTSKLILKYKLIMKYKLHKPNAMTYFPALVLASTLGQAAGLVLNIVLGQDLNHDFHSQLF